MITAVGLRSDGEVDARLIYGVPHKTTDRAAFFCPGHLVMYMLETTRRPSVFVFRTLHCPTPTAATLPAVHPVVQLLLRTKTRTAASRIRNMLLLFERRKIDPAQLSDDFWMRLGVILSARLRQGNSYLSDLLAHENLV
jgi:hypothetical protein